MIEIDIPGLKKLCIKHLVLDFNGTIACDGMLLPGVEKSLRGLSEKLEIHVITADTFGTVKERVQGIPCRVTVIPKDNQAEAKHNYIEGLGTEFVAAVGNGLNDRLMLKHAELGVAVILQEGASAKTLSEADVVVTDVLCAFSLLTNPLRLTATLRG